MAQYLKVKAEKRTKFKDDGTTKDGKYEELPRDRKGGKGSQRML